MAPEALDNVSDPAGDLSRIDYTQGPTGAKQPQKSFEQVMQQTTTPQATGATNVTQTGVSPMDLVAQNKGTVVPQNVDANTVMQSLGQAQQKTQEVQGKLTANQPTLTEQRQQDLKTQLLPNQQLQFKQKMQGANQNITDVSNSLGMDPSKFQPKTASLGPFGKFFDMLSSGQKMLTSAREQMPSLIQGGNVNPGDFLALQYKLSLATVNLEFASQILGKGQDALSKLMNINI